MLILSGDIGATNAKLAFIEMQSNSILIRKELTFINANFKNVSDIIIHAMNISNLNPQLIGLGIAGPIHAQTCNTTNLPWHINGQDLALVTGISKVHLINDLEAVAWGVNSLKSEDHYELHSGVPNAVGNIAIIAIGTGLGKAGICCFNGINYPFPSEGGHADFAPSNQLEWDMQQFFAQRYNHVSWERIVSGLGIPTILEFLLHYTQESTPTILFNEQVNETITAEMIVTAANTGKCSVCKKTLDLFVNLYGREVGNYALNILSTGGIYLAGGIAPKILSHLNTPNFLNAVFNKGRMNTLIRNMPIRVLLNNKAALYGAAIAAMRSL
jgi:glucokinase